MGRAGPSMQNLRRGAAHGTQMGHSKPSPSAQGVRQAPHRRVDFSADFQELGGCRPARAFGPNPGVFTMGQLASNRRSRAACRCGCRGDRVRPHRGCRGGRATRAAPRRRAPAPAGGPAARSGSGGTGTAGAGGARRRRELPRRQAPHPLPDRRRRSEERTVPRAVPQRPAEGARVVPGGQEAGHVDDARSGGQDAGVGRVQQGPARGAVPVDGRRRDRGDEDGVPPGRVHRRGDRARRQGPAAVHGPLPAAARRDPQGVGHALPGEERTGEVRQGAEPLAAVRRRGRPETLEEGLRVTKLYRYLAGLPGRT